MNSFIPTHLARRNLGELINQAFYQGTPFVLTRGNKPMAALIGVNEFRQIITVLEKHDPGLIDTLAIMSNPEMQDIIQKGETDVQTKNLIPFSKV